MAMNLKKRRKLLSSASLAREFSPSTNWLRMLCLELRLKSSDQWSQFRIVWLGRQEDDSLGHIGLEFIQTTKFLWRGISGRGLGLIQVAGQKNKQEASTHAAGQ